MEDVLSPVGGRRASSFGKVAFPLALRHHPGNNVVNFPRARVCPLERPQPDVPDDGLRQVEHPLPGQRSCRKEQLPTPPAGPELPPSPR